MRILAARDLGAAIRERRRQIGLGQAKLADSIGITRQWVIALEAGKPGIAVATYLRALNVLGLELSLDAGPGTVPDRDEAGTIEVLDIDAIIDKARSG